MDRITGGDLVGAMAALADTMEQNRDALCALDGAIGDADHGIGMALGFAASRDAVAGLGAGPGPTDVLNTAAMAFLRAVGASSGPLYATALMRAAAAVNGKDALDGADIAALIAAMADGIEHRGKAALGDKTMLDVWRPAAVAATAHAGGSVASVLAAAADAADLAAEATRAMQAKLGRAARLGERSIGHIDPGAASAAIVIRSLAASLG